MSKEVCPVVGSACGTCVSDACAEGRGGTQRGRVIGRGRGRLSAGQPAQRKGVFARRPVYFLRILSCLLPLGGSSAQDGASAPAGARGPLPGASS